MSFRRKEHYQETAAFHQGEPIDAEAVNLIQTYGYTIEEINELRAREHNYVEIVHLAHMYRQQYH